MTIAEAEKDLAVRLARAGLESPALRARMLIREAVGLGRVAYAVSRGEALAPEAALKLRGFAERALRGEPTAYILGRREFYASEFLVSPAVLIPRPETEILVERALALDPSPAAFADLGCGSGCAGLSIARERPGSRPLLLDISAPALAVARANGYALGVGAAYVLGDVFAPPLFPASLDLIVANPPYVAPGERAEVCAETLAYEPSLALFSGEDGMAHIAAVIAAARLALRPGGWLLFEHGHTQRGRALQAVAAAGFVDAAALDDLAGLPRVILARKP